MLHEKIDGTNFEKLMTGELTEEDFTPINEADNVEKGNIEAETDNTEE